MAESTVNPYVAIVAKKSRNLHKKWDKIMKADSQQKGGKILNDEQLALLATRNQVEKQLADIDQMKALLEEVAAQDKETTSGLKGEEDAQALKEASAEISDLKSEVDKLKAQLEERAEENATLQDLIARHEAALAVKTVAPPPPAPVTPVPDIMSTFQATLQQKIHKLLKLFHICARYPGDRLSADVNYFGKCLMGETSISGFKETLQESTRKAELYIDDELCSQFEASRGMTYLDISNLMDDLVVELSGPPTPPPEPEVPSSPVFNFFTDNGDFDDSDNELQLNETSRELQQEKEKEEDMSQHVQAVIIEEEGGGGGRGGGGAEGVNKKKQEGKRSSRKNQNRKNGKDRDAASSSSGVPTPESSTSAPKGRQPAWGGKASGGDKSQQGVDTSTSSAPASSNKSPRPKGGRGGAGRGVGGGSISGGGRGGKGGGGRGGKEGGKSKPPKATADTK